MKEVAGQASLEQREVVQLRGHDAKGQDHMEGGPRG